MPSESINFDIVVIGAGISGMIAANRAAQLGQRVLVLEQGSEDKYPCNTRYTGGTFHIGMREITLDEETLTERILEATAGFVSPEIASTLARDGRRVIRWLQDEGSRFMRASASEYHKWVLSPPGRSRPGLDWEGRCGDVLLQSLEKHLIERGGQLIRGARARSLIMEQDACRGVMAELSGKETSYSARAVFIADGGFQGNEDLVKQYISQRPERLKQRGAGTGRGDGMQMASRVGADLIGMDRFYGHMQSRDAMTNPNLWPYPYLDSLVTAGIVVDPEGHRFVDEGRGGVYVANFVAKLPDPMSAYVIFDQQTWDKAGKNGLIPSNPHLEKEGATIHRAESLEALAKVSGIPLAGLLQAVNEYNSALNSQSLSKDLFPTRSSSKYEPCPIVKAPFFAIPMVAGITYTMGGIRVNTNAQALRADGRPIDGLYALGAATGGLEGGPEVGYVGGLAKGGVTALLAAEHFSLQQSVT